MIRFEFGELVRRQDCRFDDGGNLFRIGGDGGAVEAGIAQTPDRLAGRAAKFFGVEIGAFAESDEENSSRPNAGLAGGVEKMKLLIRAIEFPCGEASEDHFEAGRYGQTFILERKQDKRGHGLGERIGGEDGEFHGL